MSCLEMINGMIQRVISNRKVATLDDTLAIYGQPPYKFTSEDSLLIVTDINTNIKKALILSISQEWKINQCICCYEYYTYKMYGEIEIEDTIDIEFGYYYNNEKLLETCKYNLFKKQGDIYIKLINYTNNNNNTTNINTNSNIYNEIRLKLGVTTYVPTIIKHYSIRFDLRLVNV